MARNRNDNSENNYPVFPGILEGIGEIWYDQMMRHSSLNILLNAKKPKAQICKEGLMIGCGWMLGGFGCVGILMISIIGSVGLSMSHHKITTSIKKSPVISRKIQANAQTIFPSP